ncbi:MULTISPECIES: CvpA family protein [Shouchella]|uniref:CvpA family protein n=2 Tax=Shouchella TaxID=2893057 RepID=A0ABY7W5J7_9BACI|nr:MULTISPECIES: CvpA family protein [Shouchella]MED4129221.1 CvpA family protein [Shouchella miscanthi]WDF04159.1 CvpA family protein [Shouchella hunanensis]GAF23783.1 colicin V production protein [Bacillus sp. JCM 19047]
MLSLIILVLLLFGFFIGRRRGFILQLIHLVSFFVAIFIAWRYYEPLANTIRLYIPYPDFSGDGAIGMIIQSFDAESVYYSAIAFAILFFVTKIILHIIGSMLDFVSHLPILKTVNSLLGGILGFLEIYLLLFVLLFVATVIPVGSIQGALQSSVVADLMINHTPYLSDWLSELWVRPSF